MSLIWVIVGSILQLMLALFLFMLVAFSGGGIANDGSLRKIQIGVLDLSLYALPASCFIGSGIVIYYYATGGSAYAYWWYVLPILMAAAYLFYAMNIAGG